MEPRSPRTGPFNNGAFLQSIILLGFIILLGWLDITNQLPLYINPKFIILTELSCYLLIPMFVIQLLNTLLPAPHSKEQHCHHHSSCWRFFPFLAVLIIAFAVPDNTLNANLVNNKGLNTQINLIPDSAQDIPRPLAPELKPLSLIKVTNLNYTEVISEINGFPKDYIGKKVMITGFVFRNPELAKNQISLVLYVVMCCTADSLPYGVMCEGANVENYPDGTWLSIEGVIQMSKYEEKDVPAVKITSLQPIKEPKEPYVYPYN